VTIPSFINSYLGNGFPRVILAIAHAVYLNKFLLVVFYAILINLPRQFLDIIRSLYFIQSPDILPKHHIACSIKILFLDYKISKNSSIPFLSMIDLH